MSAPTTARPEPGPQRWAGLAAFVGAVVVVAVVGGLAASGSTDTYRDLHKPAFAPPGSVFGPVWTVLYALIAVAGWLVWRRVGLDRSMLPYAVQLVLNAAWTPLFFAGGWYAAALIEIVALDAAIVWTVAAFWSRSRPASLLLLPYLAWSLFATALTAAIWWLNR